MELSSNFDTSVWRVRELEQADLEDCYALSTEAGWNQTRKDWSFIIDNSGTCGIERIGVGIVATTVAFSRIWTRWIAMVLTAKDWRGNGLASELLRLFDLGKSDRVDYLDATSQGAPLYEKCGFVPIERIIRYQGQGTAGVRNIESEPAIREISSNDQLITLSNIWEKGASMAVWCPAAKTYFKRMFPQGCLAINSGENRAAVWTRPGRLAWQVGPLVAENFADAEGVLDACLNAINDDVFIDVPEERQSMISCMEERGFKPVREFVRMRCGPERYPRVPKMKRWATAGPDFG